VVYPIIKESEKMDLKDLHDGYESIVRAFPIPQYQVSIVHGQMKPADKDFEMQRFVKGETQIMVATTVIEVGVNVPNASVMIIENAEEIHCIESSFSAYIDNLMLGNLKFAHRYARPEARDDFKHEFTYKAYWKILL
jgi:hypothetical protein